MSRSQRLLRGDVEAVFRLAREACELGQDAVAWRSHMLERLEWLVESTTSMAFVGKLPFDAAQLTMPLFVGRRLDPHWVKYADCRDVRPDPCTAWIAPKLGGSFTDIRQKMCDERAWYGSEYFNEILRPIRQDHYLVSVVAVPEQRVFSTIGLVGRLGGPPFTERHRKIVEMLHRELALLWRTPSLSPDPPWRDELSPRLIEILDGLLEGLSEKQIALRLSLRRPTVHNHISRLHDSFGVNSRGELLARARPTTEFRPRLIPPLRPASSRSSAPAETMVMAL